MIKTSQSQRSCRKPRTTRLRPSAILTPSLLFERLQRALPKDRELQFAHRHREHICCYREQAQPGSRAARRSGARDECIKIAQAMIQSMVYIAALEHRMSSPVGVRPW